MKKGTSAAAAGSREGRPLREPEVVNRLCRSCRRECKQPALAVVASCPRYYPGPRVTQADWRQLPLPL